MTALKVKICGVTNAADASLAEEAGAAYVGAILVPESPRAVSADQARTLSEAVRIPLVIVTANLAPAELARVAKQSGARAIQLHGEESEADLEALRGLGDWELWKAVRVRSPDDIVGAVARFAEVADLLLLDGWHPTARGGSGTRFSWDEAAAYRGHVTSSLRLGVAGGLTVENVAEAVRLLAPDLADVSSGVESSPGQKDPKLLRSFVRRALKASREPAS